MECKRRRTWVCGICWVGIFMTLYTYSVLNSYQWDTKVTQALYGAKDNGSGKRNFELVSFGTVNRGQDLYLLAVNSSLSKGRKGYSEGAVSSTVKFKETDVQLTVVNKNGGQKEKKKERRAKKLYLMSEEEYMLAKKRNRERLLHIKKSCQRFKIRSENTFLDLISSANGNYINIAGKFFLPQAPYSTSFQVDWADKMLFCWQYKVGSTAWNAMFAHLLNQTKVIEQRTFYDMRVIMAPTSNAQMQKALGFYRFMVVRHPLERLLSAYRDRIEDTTHRSWQREYFGPEILAHSRPHLKKSEMKPRGVLEIIPTFAEFVSYLVETPLENYDPHWAPFWRHCVPCVMRYHAVSKSETHDQDVRFILEDSGLSSKVDITILEENAHQGRGNTKELMLKYYSTLSLKTLEKIYRKYEVDFFLFDYDIQPLLCELYPDKNITFPSSFR